MLWSRRLQPTNHTTELSQLPLVTEMSQNKKTKSENVLSSKKAIVMQIINAKHPNYCKNHAHNFHMLLCDVSFQIKDFSPYYMQYSSVDMCVCLTGSAAARTSNLIKMLNNVIGSQMLKYGYFAF
jgi:hypothetical protein